MDVSIVIFYLSASLVIYAYVGYPLVLLVLSRIRHYPVKRSNIVPSVSLIIAAYNEARDIAEKLRNSLSLDYDPDRLEIIVVSDCSSDGTDAIAKEFENQGIKVLRLAERRGKTAAQNCAVSEARGDILVFSDATTIYKKDALRKLVRAFSEPKVGAVGGNLVFVANLDNVLGAELGLHRRQEQWLKKKEGRIRSILGVEGCIYAIRRELYQPIVEHLTSDFAGILQVVERGYRVIHESEAIAYEEAALTVWGEFKRKVRTIHGGMGVVMAKKHLLNPFKWGFISFSLFSHKILRWVVPFCLILMFISNFGMLDKGSGYQFILLGQIGFYITAIVGAWLERIQISLKPFNLSFYFCFINLAALAGLQHFLTSRYNAVWHTERTRK